MKKLQKVHTPHTQHKTHTAPANVYDVETMSRKIKEKKNTTNNKYSFHMKILRNNFYCSLF